MDIHAGRRQITSFWFLKIEMAAFWKAPSRPYAASLGVVRA
jgi:hypothetical protein